MKQIIPFILFTGLIFGGGRVNATCTPSISITSSPASSAGNLTICAGTSVTFTADTTGSHIPLTASATFKWRVNGVNSGTTTISYSTNTLSSGDVVECLMVLTLSGCNGTYTSNTITVSVDAAAPATPGAMAGTAPQCPAAAGQAYSVAAVTGATSYTWTVPTGWSITSGASTHAINVTTGTTGQNGNISVTANNSCGSSAASTLPVTVGNAIPAATAVPSGPVSPCPGATGLVYTVPLVTNATSYIWSAPAGWTITNGNGTNSVTVTAGTTGQNGNINVNSGDACGNSAVSSLAVTVAPGSPAIPGTITGNASPCPGVSQTYSISAVTNATTYTWTVPTGWTINTGSGSSSITVTTGTTGQNGNISVTAGNPCGTSGVKTLAVTVANGIPATPGSITGNTNPCPGVSHTYSISSVINASGYTWSVPFGWTINSGSNTTSITVTTGSTGQNGNISVTADNGCGSSSAQTLAVTVANGTPSTPGAIFGGTTQCPGITGLSYSVSSVANATGYTWTVPAGWSVTGGAGTNTITVTSGSAGQNGNISVTASNPCGTSAASTLAVSVANGIPATPGAINGSASQCPALTGQTYSISSVTNATGYTWSVPAGWVVTSGATTNSISVTTGAAGQNGNISVTASNGCGTSSAQSLAVTVYPLPSVTLAINSPKNQCQTGNTFNFSANDNSGGTIQVSTYQWTFSSLIPSSSSSQAPTISFSNNASSTQQVNLTLTTNHGCVKTLHDTIDVYVMPDSAFVIDATSHCQDTLVAITPHGPASYNSFTTDWGDGTINNTLTHYYSSSASPYTITFTPVTSHGCKDSTTRTVLIYPKPHASFVIDSSLHCRLSNDIRLTDASTVSSALGSTVNVWNYSFGDGTMELSQSPHHPYLTISPDDSTYVITQIVISNHDCRDTTHGSVRVYANPTVRFTDSTRNSVRHDTLCRLTPYQLTAAAGATSYPDGPYQYLWNTTATTPSITGIAPNQTLRDTFSVHVTDIHGCNADSFRVLQFFPNPDTPIIYQPDTVCNGAQNIQYIVTNPNTADKYYWRTNPSDIQISGRYSSIANLSLPSSATGSALVWVSATDNTTHCAVNGYITTSISSTPAPTAQVFLNAGTTLICNDNSASSYQWGFEPKAGLKDSTLSGETQQIYLPSPLDTANVFYWVKIKDGSCSSKIYLNGNAPVVQVSIGTINGNGIKASIYPNPVSEYFILSLQNANADNCNIEVYDLNGRKVFAQQATFDQQSALRVSTDAWSAGSYVLHISSAGGVSAVLHLVKE